MITGFQLAKLIGEIPRTKLSGSEKAVLRAMADYYPNIFPSAATLGERAGCSAWTVTKKWTSLAAKGLISTTGNRKGGRDTNHWTINVKAVLALIPAKDSHGSPATYQGQPLEGPRAAHAKSQGSPVKLTDKQSIKKTSSTKTSTKARDLIADDLFAETMTRLSSVMMEIEEEPLQSNDRQRRALRPHVIRYGRSIVEAVFRLYLPNRPANSRSWPLFDFATSFPVWLEKAKKTDGPAQTIAEVYRAINWLPIQEAMRWSAFTDTMTAEERSALERIKDHNRRNKEQLDYRDLVLATPFDNGSMLLALKRRADAWAKDNREWIDAQYRQQEKEMEVLTSSGDGGEE